MSNGSFLRVCRILDCAKNQIFSSGVWVDQGMVPGFGVWAEYQSIGTSGKNQRACYLAPKNSPLVHILSFRSQGVVSLFIFPTGLTALDSEPRGRRYVKNTRHNSNRLYSRAIHCPASMEKHYVQWFILKSVQDIMVCEKIRFCLLESGRTKPWFPGLVSRPSAKAQEPVARSRGLVIQPQKTLSWCIF